MHAVIHAVICLVSALRDHVLLIPTCYYYTYYYILHAVSYTYILHCIH
jgi:hypothetical protein